MMMMMILNRSWGMVFVACKHEECSNVVVSRYTLVSHRKTSRKKKNYY